MKVRSWGSFQMWLAAVMSVGFGYRGMPLEAVIMLATCIVVAALDRLLDRHTGDVEKP